ncbi:Fanconi anemia core complex-associated protein 100 isoform X2 [Nothobranchius furzeri]|uniref:Fanconi anemia core complex-associated protein 100 isoform X2 n=1 Tax=Nothobranchius furzeri TaxID=105023 RepID=UPI002403B811|nr:Fanconi anemia core complex-associated protein 100 isoform X2 [Nothobranchius furzeri]
MEGRSSVETWAEFGFLGKSGSPKVKCGFGTNMFISTGSNEVYVYSTDEKKLKAILQFPGSVTDLVESCDAQLFVACRRGVYGFNLQLLSHRHQSSSVAASSSPDEIDISSEFLVAGADGVSSLLLVGSVLLTLSQSGASWLLTLYKRPEQTLPSSYEVIGSFCLPLVSPVIQGEVQLLGLSARGQLQSIRLPLRGQEVGPSKPLSSQVSRSVRDLLSAIGDVCERASVLKTVIKSKNLSLRQLNQVVNISFLLTARGKTREPPTEEKSIRCHSTVSWSRSLQKDCLNLTCVLENSSGYVLERGWTLSISVHPLSGPGEETSSVNFSFPFHSLCPGETLEVSLPVAAAGDTSFPLTLNCSLIFSLSSFLAEVDLASFPDLQDSCFSLPLNTLTVDWLHALQVVRPKETVTLQSSTMDALQAFLSSHQLRCSRGGGASNPEEYSVCVRVSSEFLRNTLMLKNSIQQPESASPNICSSLLGWLLFGDHEGVKSGHQGEGMDSNSLVLHARAPSVSTVKITAKEVSAEEANTGRGESCQVIVEIQIESSSITAVCGLHHAVLHRMQTLLKKTPDEAAPSTQVQTSGLRRALQRAEVLHTQISEALSVGLSSGQTNPFLLRVYQELRENPLLII